MRLSRTPLTDADINLTLTLTLTQGCRVVTLTLTLRSALTLLGTLTVALSCSPTLTLTLTLALSCSGLIVKLHGYVGVCQQRKFVGRGGRAAGSKGDERSGPVGNGTLVVVFVVASIEDLRVKGALDDAGL